jgi:hypothetical protein
VSEFPAYSNETLFFFSGVKYVAQTCSLSSLQFTLSSFVVRSVVSSFCLASSSRMRLQQLCFNQV